jgi:hypothetical protein
MDCHICEEFRAETGDPTRICGYCQAKSKEPAQDLKNCSKDDCGKQAAWEYWTMLFPSVHYCDEHAKELSYFLDEAIEFGWHKYPRPPRPPVKQPMKMFLWEYTDNCTGCYHNGGGVMIIDTTLENARAHWKKDDDNPTTCSILEDKPDKIFELAGMPEREIFVFPDAGCC